MLGTDDIFLHYNFVVREFVLYFKYKECNRMEYMPPVDILWNRLLGEIMNLCTCCGTIPVRQWIFFSLLNLENIHYCDDDTGDKEIYQDWIKLLVLFVEN